MLTIIPIQIYFDQFFQFDHLLIQKLFIIALQHYLCQYVLFGLLILQGKNNELLYDALNRFFEQGKFL